MDLPALREQWSRFVQSARWLEITQLSVDGVDLDAMSGCDQSGHPGYYQRGRPQVGRPR